MRFYQQQHPFYCGVDLHARSMHVCLVNQTGETLVHKNIEARPDRFLNPDKFNADVRPVSDVKNTADLLHVLSSVKVEGVCYRPDLASGVVTLDALLNGKSMFGRREDAEVRACAAVALGRVGTPDAQASLRLSANEKDVVVRTAVARALRGQPT